MLCFLMFFTVAPIFSVVTDEDIKLEQAMDYAPLYRSLQKGKSLSIKKFLIWVWQSVFQGGIISMSAIYFTESQSGLSTVAYTSLVLVEILNVYSLVNKYTWQMIVASACTFVVFITIVFEFEDVLKMEQMSLHHTWQIVLATLMTWLPIHILRLSSAWLNPPKRKRLLSVEL